MRPQRQPLVAFQSAVVTSDTAQALRTLDKKVAEIGGFRLRITGCPRQETVWEPWTPGPLGNPPPYSMRPAGREVYLALDMVDPDEHMTPANRLQTELEVLWGLAIPLGFTPWSRYPLAGMNDDVFHFLGPWQGLMDHLAGEGRGEWAWPSVCAAAQSDVGTWMGSNRLERFVQAQLHRLGIHCGPVDGIIGPSTSTALQALGLPGNTLEDNAKALSQFRAPPTSKEQRRRGHIILPNENVNLLTYGKVAATKLNQGYTLTIDGPGRVVINIGDL